MNTPSRAEPLTRFFNLAVLAACFHAFMEWLFFVTQSSSLSTLSMFEKIKVLFVTGGVLAYIALALLLLLALPAQKWQPLGLIPAALMLAVAALLLLDNFTYTVFKVGIVSTVGAWRLVYIVVFILLFYWMFRFLRRQHLSKHASLLTLSLLAISTAFIYSIYTALPPGTTAPQPRLFSPTAERPNIIIIGGDGLNATYLSAYGFDEDTTPFLAEMAKSSLVAENAFTNASSTTASTTSALTGREPAGVKVYRYPDILSGEDSFQHLPGILKQMGYHTVQIGTPSYVDARKLNLIEGFDVVNGESLETPSPTPAPSMLQPLLGSSPSAYFVETVLARAAERLLHIFFLKEMSNPFQQVTDPSARLTDAARVEQILRTVNTTDQPVFIFSHFMNTHGPHFSSEGANPAQGEDSAEDEKEWDLEEYKQAIRSFDAHLATIYTDLEASGELQNTILVIYTDHGYRYVVNQRIPFIIRFPNAGHAGVRENNVQIIDLPPTLLNYLGEEQPAWMTGASLLSAEPPALRPIISITAGSPRKIKPPFFQIKSVQVVVCQKWYALNVQENTWHTGAVKGHTAACPPALLPPDRIIRETILNYLESYGYDIETLK